MPRYKAVKQIRPDGLVVVCSYCPDAKKETEDLETQGKSVTHGICPRCIDKWKMDSVKGSVLEIKAA